jgi:NaMN:DMB phosphoribosyltransferase
MPEPVASLDEIRALLTHLPGPDLEAGSAAAAREAQLTKPAGALGRLEELAGWLATWQARHRPAIKDEAADPFELLRRLGGLEFAAMAGAILAARMGRVPVVLDGFCSAAAAAVLYAADKRALDHCVAGHVSAEPGHRLLLERIEKPPLLDLGMRLGEASGATLALAVLKAAVACHSGMATFADAGVSGPAK